MIEAHIHVLPGIDDGSDSVETSQKMMEILRQQGVDRIIATPHFYAHREKDVETFLAKREAAFDALGRPENMRLGAEVRIEQGVSLLPGIEKLAFEGSDLILMEFPYAKFAPWMIEEVYNLADTYGLTPIIAHVHRYFDFFTTDQLKRVLSMGGVIFQANNEYLETHKERKLIKGLMKDGYPLIFGSDAHNLGSRKPNWDRLVKKTKSVYIEEAMELLRKHLD
ncbi:MAG: capsular polysaccharide biosynthesis protein [Lachnospiraceae bacterium]|nr:capsular polysaccharide biosynthesis protein [Lachnospiraceae bacterium]